MSKKTQGHNVKTINIKGKDYVPVAERVRVFTEQYEEGCIKTEFIKCDESIAICRAVVTPDVSRPERYYTGTAMETATEKGVNSDSHIENSETSAVGRALGMMGIGVLDSIASADEINSYHNKQYQAGEGRATGKQIEFIKSLAKEKGFTPEQVEKKYGKLESLKSHKASSIIENLQKLNSIKDPQELTSSEKTLLI